MKLYRVVGPNFVAGFEADSYVRRSAPILVRWIMGKHVVDAFTILQAKRFHIEALG